MRMATPSPNPEPLLVQDTVPCFRRAADSLCKQVHRWTHSDWLAQSSDWLIAKPARILLIVLVAVLLKKLVHRAIRRLCERAVNGTVHAVLTRVRSAVSESTLANERRTQRAATMASVLQSIATGVIYSIALLMSLSELTFNIGPLIASAGIIGVAVGFGSQSLVKDFLSGVFMILEDQYGVGDQVDLGPVKGLVEAVGLRITRVRDLDGTVWYVRNGEIARVGNQTQGWSRVVIDLDVPHGQDLDRVRELLVEAGDRLMSSEFADSILERPAVWGVQAITQDAVVMRVTVKTQSSVQPEVGRAFRGIIADTLFAHDVDIGARPPTLLLQSDGSTTEHPVTTPAGPAGTDATSRDPGKT